MLNICTFIGNLGRDPEIRTMQNGNKVCNLSLGVSEKWKDKSGERQERTEWVRIVVFGNLVDVAERYLSKGSKIFVSGKMQTRKWQDQSGNDKYSTEVVLNGFDGKLVMLDGPKERAEQGDASPPVDRYPSNSTEPPRDNLDDEIPF